MQGKMERLKASKEAERRKTDKLRLQVDAAMNELHQYKDQTVVEIQEKHE